MNIDDILEQALHEDILEIANRKNDYIFFPDDKLPELQQKLKSLRRELLRNANIKNPRKIDLNNIRAKKRREIQLEIDEIETKINFLTNGHQ